MLLYVKEHKRMLFKTLSMIYDNQLIINYNKTACSLFRSNRGNGYFSVIDSSNTYKK